MYPAPVDTDGQSGNAPMYLLKVVEAWLRHRQGGASVWVRSGFQSSFAIKGNSKSTRGKTEAGNKQVHSRKDSDSPREFAAVGRLLLWKTGGEITPVIQEFVGEPTTGANKKAEDPR